MKAIDLLRKLKDKAQFHHSRIELDDMIDTGWGIEMDIDEALEEFDEKPIDVSKHNPFFNFSYKTPEKDQEIYYLLGNGVDGINCPLVMFRTYFNEKGRDFEKDVDGNYKNVVAWSPVKRKV